MAAGHLSWHGETSAAAQATLQLMKVHSSRCGSAGFETTPNTQRASRFHSGTASTRQRCPCPSVIGNPFNIWLGPRQERIGLQPRSTVGSVPACSPKLSVVDAAECSQGWRETPEIKFGTWQRDTGWAAQQANGIRRWNRSGGYLLFAKLYGHTIEETEIWELP